MTSLKSQLTHLTGGRLNDEELEDLVRFVEDLEERSKLIVIVDLAWCVGKLRGLGHPNEAIEKRWQLSGERNPNDYPTQH